MTKKESTERGHMIPEEVKEHLKKFKGFDEKIRYLDKILERRGLSEGTQRAVRKTLGELYQKEGNESISEVSGFEGSYRRIEGHGRTAELYRRAAENFEKAGEDYAAKEFRRLSEKQDTLSSRHKDRQFRRAYGLEKATATASIVGILGGIFFLSSNITGNAIADLTTKTTSFIGAGLLIVGLVAGFFWVKSRKK